MSEDLRYFCLRCRRTLVNDSSLKERDHEDTASYHKPSDELRHDDCGGLISMSRREAQAR